MYDSERVVFSLFSWMIEYEWDEAWLILDYRKPIQETIYRGAVAKVERCVEGNTIKIGSCVSSWTTDYGVAESFATERLDDVECDLDEDKESIEDYTSVVFILEGGCEGTDVAELASRYKEELDAAYGEYLLDRLADQEKEILTDITTVKLIKVEKDESIYKIHVKI